MAWSSQYVVIWAPVAQGGDTTSQSVAKHILELSRIYNILSTEIAPIAHTHVKTEITDFTHTHDGLLPSGTILLWSGAVLNIPAGFVLCNGSNGTPDLRNRFVVGAGDTYQPSATGGALTHYHTTQGHTLTIQEIPSHSHDYYVALHPYASSNNNTLGSDSNALASTSSVGGGQSHSHGNTGSSDNIPPYYALCYIMKT